MPVMDNQSYQDKKLRSIQCFHDCK